MPTGRQGLSTLDGGVSCILCPANVVEHLVQRYLALIASFDRIQMRADA